MRYNAFRHAAYDTPWWAFPSSKEGRFHRAATDTVQYLSLHPLGPAAEMLRNQVGPDGDPAELLLNLWTATLDLDDVAEIDFANSEDWGCTAEELVGDDYAPTQSLALRVRESGANAMTVPSAALPGTHNLVVFGARVMHPYLWSPISPDDVPTGHLTEGGRPAAEVVGCVRWIDIPHAGIQQWRATGSYDILVDPAPR